ncbi:iron uptake transporter permease EfeU [Raineyella fluvialis]|uniref:iron uptake transporter permease EfeU n=1 Tax=Raineyella fluvialis TaxID=2662261 RepID=UPI001EF00AFF|nr:iron uptake transporter permease EfeU [Raineyella fluvialis]
MAFGAILTFGPSGLSFEAQEIIGGSLSLVAVGLVTWMIFWMARHAKHLSGELKGSIDNHAASGRGGMVLVALLAVGREGLETALFLWAATRAAAGTSEGGWVPLTGAALGLVSAILIGWLIYRGALRLDLGMFFTWTGAFLILVAAGVLAYAFHDLQEGGLVPGLDAVAWDISGLVPPTSIVGSVLKGVFNFTPSPTLLEAAAWIVYVAIVLPLYFIRLHRGHQTSTESTTATTEGVHA